MPDPDARATHERPLDERAGYGLVPAVAAPLDVVPTAVPVPVTSPGRGISMYAPADVPRVHWDLRRALLMALETEWERGTAFAFVPVFLAAGALVYFNLAREPTVLQVCLPAATVAALAWFARSRLLVHLALIGLLCFSLGIVFAKLETWRAGTKMLGGEISTRLTGRVVLIEHQAKGRERLTLDILATDRPKLKYAPDRVRVSARTIPEGLKAGDAIAGVARLVQPSGPTRPGGYDFSFESYFDGIGANGFFLKTPDRVGDAAPASLATRFFAEVENLRSRLSDRIRTAIDGEAEGEIAAALVAGVRGGIPDDVNEALRRTGLAHILSISGLHMALVAATIMLSLRAAFALFAGFASRRPVKKYAAAAGLAALAAYLFMSGAAVAAERSFLMLGIMLLAVIFDRAALTMRNLAIAAIAIIVVSPHEVAGPSFQMSFAATAALIGAYSAWSQRERRSAAAVLDQGLVAKLFRYAGSYTLGLIVTSLIAGTATAVFGAYHFQRVSPLGLFANLAAMPIVSVLVMPFALIGVVLMPFGLDQWAFAIMGKGLTAMIAVAEWFSAISPFDSVGAVPAGAVVLITLALVLSTLPTTWLRLAAVPVALAGIAAIATRELPHVLVSEDGRLVVAIAGGGDVAVNRSRPSAFVMKDWQRAMDADAIVKPTLLKSKAAAGSGVAGAEDTAISDTRSRIADGIARAGDAAAAAASGIEADVAASARAQPGFSCNDTACAALADGALVIHAADAAAASSYCGTAALIVIDDAAANAACPDGESATITKRDLARRGGASVSFTQAAGQYTAEIVFAIDQPYRPWHANRAFSREARGLPPYQRKTDPAEAADIQPQGAAAATPPISSDGSARSAGPAP